MKSWYWQLFAEKTKILVHRFLQTILYNIGEMSEIVLRLKAVFNLGVKIGDSKNYVIKSCPILLKISEAMIKQHHINDCWKLEPGTIWQFLFVYLFYLFIYLFFFLKNLLMLVFQDNLNFRAKNRYFVKVQNNWEIALFFDNF